MMTEHPHTGPSSAHHVTDPGGRLPRRGGSSMLARLVSPFAAVVPWLLTMAGLLLASRWLFDIQRVQASWEAIIGGAVLLIVAALIWAALTAWSSVGTFIAGASTVAVGVLLAEPEVYLWVATEFSSAGGTNSSMAFSTFTPVNFFLFGSLLVAAALGAAGARRRG